MRGTWLPSLAVITLAGCTTAQEQASVLPPPPPCMQTGLASWYHPAAGNKATSDGSHPSPDALTAAHASLPFGTKLLVTDVASGRSVVVRVTDRGPFKPDRIVDLSAQAAQTIGMKQDGVTQVRLEIDQPPGDAAPDNRCLFTQVAAS